MKAQIKVTPIDSGISSEMADAVQGFISANGLTLSVMDKAWAVYWIDGDAFGILGFAGCNVGNRIADVPVYHIAQGKTRNEKWLAMQAHERLFERVCGFIADTVGSGTKAFFYIAPESQKHWEGFAERVNGRKAERYVMEV